MFAVPRKAPGERKRHPAQFWREQKLARHVTRGGRGAVGRLFLARGGRRGVRRR